MNERTSREGMMSKEEFLEIFGNLLNRHSDDIPKEIVHQNETREYKVQGNWLQGVTSSILEAIEAGFITDPVFIARFRKFSDALERRRMDYLAAPVVSSEEEITIRTTPEEIEEGNKLLREAIELLQKTN